MKNQILKNSLKVISITVCTFLFHAETVKAQITFGEVKEAPKEISDWERYCIKELCAPYDSTSFIVEPLPLIDAYKKYIGQQLFLLEVGFYDKQLIYAKPTKYSLNGDLKESDVYFPKYEDSNTNNNIEKIVNKYYVIIDVIPYDKYPYLLEYGKELHSSTRTFAYNDSKGIRQVKWDVPCVAPCFVMKETQSGDTVYTFQPDKYILVGAFVKLKNEHIGKTFVNYVVSDDNEDLKLQNKWKCTDVTFVKNKPSFVLKNVDIESTEITLDCFGKFRGEPTLETYFVLKEGRQRRGEKYWALEKEFNKYSNELLAANKVQEKERLERQEQNTTAKAQRRQALITKYGQTIATKILNQEPEIGMTKAMFNDMKLLIVSTQKKETSNGLVETFICQYSLYKCKKIIIINQKIKQIDTYNCN